MAEPELRPRQEGERWRAPEARLSRDTAGRQAGMGSAVSPGAGGGGKEKAPGELLGTVTARGGVLAPGLPQLRKGGRALPGLELKLHPFPKLPHICQLMQEF